MLSTSIPPYYAQSAEYRRRLNPLHINPSKYSIKTQNEIPVT